MRRGQIAKLLFWIFYLPIAFFLFVQLWQTTASAMDNAFQTYQADATIMDQRIRSSLDSYDPVVGARHNILRDDLGDKLGFSLSEKMFAYQVTVGEKTYYANEKWYKDARPLTPRRYKLISSYHVYQRGDQEVPVTIEQVWPERYDKFR